MRFNLTEIIDSIKYSRDFLRGDVVFIQKHYSVVLIIDNDKEIELTQNKLHSLYLMYIHNTSAQTDRRICFVQYIIDHYKNEYTEYEIVETQQLNSHENQLPQASPHHSTNALGLRI